MDVANTDEHSPSVVVLRAKCGPPLPANPTLVSNRLIRSAIKAQADLIDLILFNKCDGADWNKSTQAHWKYMAVVTLPQNDIMLLLAHFIALSEIK